MVLDIFFAVLNLQLFSSLKYDDVLGVFYFTEGDMEVKSVSFEDKENCYAVIHCGRLVSLRIASKIIPS